MAAFTLAVMTESSTYWPALSRVGEDAHPQQAAMRPAHNRIPRKRRHFAMAHSLRVMERQIDRFSRRVSPKPAAGRPGVGRIGERAGRGEHTRCGEGGRGG